MSTSIWFLGFRDQSQALFASFGTLQRRSVSYTVNLAEIDVSCQRCCIFRAATDPGEVFVFIYCHVLTWINHGPSEYYSVPV